MKEARVIWSAAVVGNNPGCLVLVPRVTLFRLLDRLNFQNRLLDPFGQALGKTPAPGTAEYRPVLSTGGLSEIEDDQEQHETS